MPFENVDIKKRIEEKKANDREFARIFNESEKEYALIRQLIVARKKKKLTQSRLARLAGLKQQAVSRIETRENEPTLGTFLKLAEAAGLSVKLVPAHAKAHKHHHLSGVYIKAKR